MTTLVWPLLASATITLTQPTDGAMLSMHRGDRISPTIASTFPERDTVPTSTRLTVRPREMATGKTTEKAGISELAEFSGYYVYVPKQCVGDKRSPLVVLLHGGGRSGHEEVTKFQTLADKYGMIILAPNALEPGRWDVLASIMSGATKTEFEGVLVRTTQFQERDIRHIDSAMIKVLATHAIDPDRIALLGFSDGGSYSFLLGRSNMDVFSRIAALSPMIPFKGSGPQNTATQFFLSAGINESYLPRLAFMVGAALRQEGHAVRTQIGLRTHVDQIEDETFVWQWLVQSWAEPTTTTHLSKEPEDPVLTADGVEKFTKFWTQFISLPDSIVQVARMQHQIEKHLIVGTEPTTTVITDFVSLARTYPAVAAALTAAGISAEEAMAYRIALIRTAFARTATMTLTGTPVTEAAASRPIRFDQISPTTILGKNLEFWQKNKELIQPLTKSKFFSLQ